MQNARLSELERLLAKSNVSATGRGHSSDFKSSKEYNALAEENRVVSDRYAPRWHGLQRVLIFRLRLQLMEAMDVLQRQVDEYESEMRVLKDFKTPTKRGQQGSRTPGTRTPRRMLSSGNEPGSPRPGTDDAPSTDYSLEATIFRPALQQALRESWKWKAAATSIALSDLPPLPVPFGAQSGTKDPDELIQLSSALSEARMQKASIKMVDLRNTEKTPRAQFQETRSACLEASRKLETLLLKIRASQ